MKRLKIAVGPHAHLEPLRDGRVTSSLVEFDFADHPVISRAFAPMVERQAFDVSEIALGAFLQAHAAGKPLALLPAVEVGGFHHAYLRRLAASDPVPLTEVSGGTLGSRSYSQTTGLWVRAILAEQFGVDLDTITWLTQEAAHSAGYTDPPNVRRDPQARSTPDLLDAGEIVAAVIGPEIEGTVPVLPDPTAAADEWFAEHRTVGINHMICLTHEVCQDADVVAEVYRMITESHALVLGAAEDRELLPGVPGAVREGVERVRAAFDLGARYARDQRMIPSAPRLDEVLPESLRDAGGSRA
ncbi:hypothetical protein [Nocardia miyunensis]|uniref:hypothetical protein n=1 Tax=Nocardia miyunensis TaxID=282684 RepID=UPI0008365DC5|nr:hypothetical protein [Nocardia miyunensis]